MVRQVNHDGSIVPLGGDRQLPQAPCVDCPRPQPQPMRGLGDAVARATQALGIPKCAPCAQRQARLNQLWSFGTPPRS